MTYDIPDQRSGNTYDGAEFTVSINAVAANLTGASITLEIWPKGKPTEITKRFTVGSGLTITNAVGGVFTLNPFVCDMADGQYNYDATITFADGKVKTYIEGTWLIVPNNRK